MENNVAKANKQGQGRFIAVAISLASLIRKRPAFQDTIEAICCYVDHSNRKELEDTIMENLYNDVMMSTKQAFRWKVCTSCGERRHCGDAEGLAISAATDGLIKAVKSFQGRRQNDIAEEQAFLAYLSQSIAGKLDKECKHQCNLVLKQQLQRHFDANDEQMTFEEFIAKVGLKSNAYIEAEREVLTIETAHNTALHIIAKWMTGNRDGISDRPYEHLQTIVQQVKITLPKLLPEGRAEAVGLFLAKQSNINIWGFDHLHELVIQHCCQARSAFDVHQKRVREAIKKQLVLGGDGCA